MIVGTRSNKVLVNLPQYSGYWTTSWSRNKNNIKYTSIVSVCSCALPCMWRFVLTMGNNKEPSCEKQKQMHTKD